MPLQLPSIRRFLFDLNVEINELYRKYHRWLDNSEISEFETLVLILEDRRFLNHRGVDVWSVAREFIKAAMFRSHGGASTIEMQFIRTVNNRRERTLIRKIREFILAYVIQYHFDKKALLRSYLDIAFFGSGLYGAEAAANKAYGKYVSELNLQEAASIAAMLVYPMPLNPSVAWRQKVERRAAYALRLRTRFYKSLEKVKRGHIIKIR